MAKGSRIGARATATAGKIIPSAGRSVGTFAQLTDIEAQQIRDDVDDRYDADVTDAIKLYISDSNPNGDGFSHSQNLNYKLENGGKLNTTEKFIDDNIQSGMHDIGKDIEITRYAHDDILQQIGINDYSKFSDSQLKSKLVGVEYQTKSYDSYSYDAKKNPFAPNAINGNGREVTIITKAKSDTKMVFGAKKQSEMIINKGTKHKIVDVYYDGTTAYPRNKASKPRVVIVTETE